MESLTSKEKAFYEYIADTIHAQGFPPSVRDIQQALGIKSTSTVHAYLQRLEEKGYIRKTDRKSRSLRVSDPTPTSSDTAHIPIVGTVAAGTPILAAENIEDYIDLPLTRRSLRSSDLFALRVKGESMIGAGIMNGDIIVVKKENVAENGEIVVALVGDEATVKTYYRENGHFRLQPENPTMAPIIVEDELLILGKVVSVHRFY
ncbi:MAG: transcriptional repressor LexA [Eubacteriales bacterium]